tara:strand:- start:2984 stop:3307 length:324 start_codon:yes stop_codon:yes gene_type:complete
MNKNQTYSNDLELAYFGWDETFSANNIRDFYPNENNIEAKRGSDIKSISERLIIKVILMTIFLILILEDLEWITFSSSKRISENCIDKSGWNINNMLNQAYGINQKK